VSEPGVLKIATRKSQLALWQAEHVAALIRAAHPDVAVELLPLSTTGDRIVDRSLAAIGGKGLFIKELESALYDHSADLAVHSMKDVPAELPPGFTIAAVLPRADPHDALVTDRANRFADLPKGARLGTSSLRRQAQLLAARPDLVIVALRGNVDTRLKRLLGGELDAIVLACAGLTRLGLESRITERLDPKISLPAVGQGVIGVECRVADSRTRRLLHALEDAPTRATIEAERAFARRLGGSCQSPIAGFARLDPDLLTLEGLVAEPDGSRVLRDCIAGNPAEPQRLGVELAERLLAAGAAPLLERLRRA